MPKPGIYWVKLYSPTVEREKIDKWFVAKLDDYYGWEIIGSDEIIHPSMVAEIGSEILPPCTHYHLIDTKFVGEEPRCSKCGKTNKQIDEDLEKGIKGCKYA
jgi:hypothetical protein